MGGEDDVRIPDLVKSFIAAVLFVAAVCFLNVYLLLAVLIGVVFTAIWASAHIIMFGDGND